MKAWIALAAVLLLAACSTTSHVRQAHTLPDGQRFSYLFVRSGGTEDAGIEQVRQAISRALADASLVAAPGQPATQLEIEVTHYYLRSDATRILAGILAGRDKVASRVRILGADGGQIGAFEVETTNISAWGTSQGLLHQHAAEIVERLKGRG